jgi:hypothetical protein
MYGHGGTFFFFLDTNERNFHCREKHKYTPNTQPLPASMGELHESVGGTINYYGGASCCFGQHCEGLFLEYPSNHTKTPFYSFSCDKLSFEQIFPKFLLIDRLISDNSDINNKSNCSSKEL